MFRITVHAFVCWWGAPRWLRKHRLQKKLSSKLTARLCGKKAKVAGAAEITDGMTDGMGTPLSPANTRHQTPATNHSTCNRSTLLSETCC